MVVRPKTNGATQYPLLAEHRVVTHPAREGVTEREHEVTCGVVSDGETTPTDDERILTLVEGNLG